MFYLRNLRHHTKYFGLALALIGLTSQDALVGCSWRRPTPSPTATMSHSSNLAGQPGPDIASSISTSTQAEPDEQTQARLSEVYGKLPLSFEANHGQTGEEVKFLSRGSGYSLFLTPTEAVLTLRKDEGETERPTGVGSPDLRTAWRNDEEKMPDSSFTALRMKLVGANPRPQVEGVGELAGKSNYFIGNDPKKWRTNIPNYARVKYEDVYPGVDLLYYGNQQQLEYDFVVAAGADPKRIRLSFEGGDKLEVDGQGDLVLASDGGQVRQRKPVVYQEEDGNKQEISGRYVVRGKHEVEIEVGAYDERKPLVIDPVMSYSTYLGGSSTDRGYGIAVDSAGNAYVTGQTFSHDFPTQNPFQVANGGSSGAFVTKLNADGSALIYSTYLGGGSPDFGTDIAVDLAGNAYVMGGTFSNDFPTQSSFLAALSGLEDVFVTKLNADGSALVYSTYLGGGSTDHGYGIAVDSAGNAYVTGYTNSTNFPTKNPFQVANAGAFFGDGFVTKFNDLGSALVYSTYLGGGVSDEPRDIAIDLAGYAYVTGRTNSPDFPTKNPYQDVLRGSHVIYDTFVTKFNDLGSALVYSTYLGGGSQDFGMGIAVDSAGNAYVTGQTYSHDFPTQSPFQPALSGFEDVFVTKLNAGGSALVYSTYLGGSNGPDSGSGIAVDLAGNAYVTGHTYSLNFPTKNPLQATRGDASEAFVTRFNALGSALVYSTYLGGSSDDGGGGIAVDSAVNVYITGWTDSLNFPTKNRYQATNGGGKDAFVTKVSHIKVPLGGELTSTTNPGFFKIYVPTKDGGRLNITTDPPELPITELKYPDGTSYTNNTETGQNKHGWYIFQVTGSNNYTVKNTFTQDGMASAVPWNFWFFPHLTTKKGLKMYDELGPYTKFDAEFNLGGKSLAWEEANHKSDSAKVWAGHCWGAVLASIIIEQPQAIRGPNSGEDFTQDDLEGLASDFFNNKAGHFLHQRTDIDPSDPNKGFEYEKPTANDTDRVDKRVHNFHKALVDMLRVARKAFVMNLRQPKEDPTRPGEERWNHGCYTYIAEMQEDPNATGNPETEKILQIKIKTTFTCNDDFLDAANVSTGDPVSNPACRREQETEYILMYGQKGEVQDNGTIAGRKQNWLTMKLKHTFGDGDVSPARDVFVPGHLVDVTAAFPIVPDDPGCANPFVTGQRLHKLGLRTRTGN